MSAPEVCPNCGNRDTATLTCDGEMHRCLACGYDGTTPLRVVTVERTETIRARVEAWLAAPIEGHGLWARYQDARDLMPELLAELDRLRGALERADAELGATLGMHEIAKTRRSIRDALRGDQEEKG